MVCPYLIIQGRIICRGTIGRAIRAIFSFLSPASMSFRPVTLSAAANASFREEGEKGGRGRGREGEGGEEAERGEERKRKEEREKARKRVKERGRKRRRERERQ